MPIRVPERRAVARLLWPRLQRRATARLYEFAAGSDTLRRVPSPGALLIATLP